MKRLVFNFNLMIVSKRSKVAANVNIWERSCVRFVDAGLEVLGCQDEVYVVVNLPVRGMPRCCLRQLVGVKNVGKGGLVSLSQL